MCVKKCEVRTCARAFTSSLLKDIGTDSRGKKNDITETKLDHTGWVEGQREKLELDLLNDITEGQCVMWNHLS